MEYATDRETIGRWAPLLVEKRGDVPIAATKMDMGTDVNFGAVSRKLLDWLGGQERCGIATGGTRSWGCVVQGPVASPRRSKLLFG